MEIRLFPLNPRSFSSIIIFFLIAAVIAVTPLLKSIGSFWEWRASLRGGTICYSTVQVLLPPLLLLLSTAALVGNSYNPFLYFQF